MALENTDADMYIYALAVAPGGHLFWTGPEVMWHFLLNVYRISHTICSWHLGDVLNEMVISVMRMVSPNDHVLCGLSGGVDSIVAPTLVLRAIGYGLHCVFVDNSLFRYEEREWLMTVFVTELRLPCHMCRCQRTITLTHVKWCGGSGKGREDYRCWVYCCLQWICKLVGRKTWNETCVLSARNCFSNPDVIESCPPPTPAGNAFTNLHTIKSHYNVVACLQTCSWRWLSLSSGCLKTRSIN